jgi:hypothetical protein
MRDFEDDVVSSSEGACTGEICGWGSVSWRCASDRPAKCSRGLTSTSEHDAPKKGPRLVTHHFLLSYNHLDSYLRTKKDTLSSIRHPCNLRPSAPTCDTRRNLCISKYLTATHNMTRVSLRRRRVTAHDARAWRDRPSIHYMIHMRACAMFMKVMS